MSRLRGLLLRALVAVAFAFILLSAGRVDAQTSPVEAVDGPLPDAAPKMLTNDSIVRMVKAGLGDDLIVQTITAQPGRYTTDADALVVLKEAGVSDRVISSMVNKSRRQITPAHETAVTVAEVNEIGVYYKDRNGNWVPIEPEIVHIKSGGFIKSTVTHGIIKVDQNGRINGPQSKLALSAPIQFLIYVPEGVAASEYDLLRFRLHSDSREFRTLTGGIIHSTGGAERDEVPWSPTKTAPRTYQFTVDDKVGGGEFGILPPGTGNVTNGGKIYTFAIVESSGK
jgi:hypothetical protein